ncbi:MAG: FAD-binding oxidoreductase [Pseudonocardiaceae bacterium]
MTVTMTTLHGPRTDLTDTEIDNFRERLRGAVLGSPTASVPSVSSPGSQTRDVFNAMCVGRPAVIAQCTGTADVVDAVNFAREHDLVVAVRGGGHSVAGLSTIEDGMLIDLSTMRGVQVDPDQRLAQVQGGALWGDVDRETQAFGLATPGGVISDTGVGGLTLGGGYGWLRRKYGLSCDNLVQAQVVCADGAVRTASAAHNPDLFWAIRGGGGNFGIVTSFTFRLHPVGPVVAFAAPFYPLQDLDAVLRGWRDYVLGAPDEVTSAVVTMTFPPLPGMPEVVHNRPCAIVVAVHTGDPDAGTAALAPLRRLGTPLFDMSQPTPYTAVQSGFDPLFPRNTLRAYWKSQYLADLTDEAIAVIADRALDRPAPLTFINILHMGGAIGAIGPQDTAFAERSAPFMVSIDGNWSDPAADAETIGWVRSAWERIRAYGTGGVYLNFTGLADEPTQAGVDDALGRNLRRLADIKARYDPDNFFRVNNNIAPAAS